jgi:hypothetical protein
MDSIFDKVIREARSTYLAEQDEGGISQQAGDPAQQAAPQGQPADAAVAPQDGKSVEQIQSGYDTFRTIIINLLRIIGQTAGAIESGDSERIQAVKSSVPNDIEKQIQIAIQQLTTAEPAQVEQSVSAILKNMAAAP